MENKMMAMRIALRDISRVAEEMTRNTMSGESVDRLTVDGWALRICDIIGSANAVPLRNCDVGTAEEQAQRFDAFCDAHKHIGDDGTNWCSTTCPCYNDIDCSVKWAQMPYEEGAVAK